MPNYGIRMFLRRKADGAWLYLDGSSGESGAVCCGSPRGRIVSDLIDEAIAAGVFIPNPEEGG